MNVSLPDFASAGHKGRPDAEWPEAQAVESGSLDLRRIFGLVGRQSRLIVLTVLIILAATAAVVFSLTPSYKASALLLVDPTRKDLLAPEAQVGSAQSDSARVDSEVEIMRSNAVLMDVVASQQLISDPEFGVRLGLRDRIAIALRLKDDEPVTAEQSLGAVMGNLRRAVSVQRRALTYVVSIDVDSVSADKAASIANAMADVYIQRQVQSKVDATLVRRDAIRDQIEVARRAVVAAENQYAEFVSSNLDRLVSATGQTDLRAMRDSLQRLTNEQQTASREMETLQRGLEQRNSTELAEQLQSQAAQELSRQRRAIVASLGQPGTSGERAVNLRLELSRVDSTLAEEARRRVNELQTTVNSSQSQVSQMRANLNSALLRADLPTDVQARVYELLQVSSNATTSYQTLLSRLQDMETQASLQVADSRVVSPALVPNSPSFPRTSLIFPAAAFFALGVGVTLAFLFDNFIGGFTSAAQVQAVTGRRLATVVPLQKKDPNQKSVADNILTRPISRYAESVRRLRAAIDRSYLQGDFRKERDAERAILVMLTSALPGEGKTTLSLSLARSLAQEGKRVLLIDCDLRRPSVHKQLGVTPTAGLPDLLNGKLTRDELQNVTIKDPNANLRVILGKREAETPADQLLNRTTFAQLIEAVARLFDYVILDSPPIEPVVDGLYVAEHVDVVAFVVHAAKTPQSVVMSALKSIDEAKPQGVETLIALNHEVEDRLTGYRTYGRYYTD